MILRESLSGQLKIKKENFIVFVLFIILFLTISIISCASSTVTFKDNTFKSLSMAASTYEETMTTIGEAYSKGIIDENEKELILETANVYWKAYHTTVISFEIYSRQQTPTNKTNVINNLQSLDNALIELLLVSQTELK